MKPHNIVGPQIRRIRYNLGWSQEYLAGELDAIGLEVCREFVAKIEGQSHRVDDIYLPFFAASLKIPLADLFPNFQSLTLEISKLHLPSRRSDLLYRGWHSQRKPIVVKVH